MFLRTKNGGQIEKLKTTTTYFPQNSFISGFFSFKKIEISKLFFIQIEHFFLFFGLIIWFMEFQTKKFNFHNDDANDDNQFFLARNSFRKISPCVCAFERKDHQRIESDSFI